MGPEAGCQYLVFVDGSEPAKRAAQLCARWMRPGLDTAQVVVAYKSPQPAVMWAEGFDLHSAAPGITVRCAGECLRKLGADRPALQMRYPPTQAPRTPFRCS